MTIKELRTAIDLVREMRAGGDKPALFVYQRTSGEILFAVFPDQRYCDLSVAPEVACWAEVVAPQVNGE